MSTLDTSYQLQGDDLNLDPNNVPFATNDPNPQDPKRPLVDQDSVEDVGVKQDLKKPAADIAKAAAMAMDAVNKGKTKLIVNYLPQCTTEGELRQLFGTVGAVESANVIRDKLKGHSLQYGFVSYADPGDAARAVETLNRRRLHDKVIKVSYARPSSEAIQDANIYVCNLPRTLTLEAVEQMFAPYGRIINSRMLMDQEGRPRGAAFIRFDRRAEAQEATRQMNGHVPPGATEGIRISKPILCKGPDSKGKGADGKSNKAHAAHGHHHHRKAKSGHSRPRHHHHQHHHQQYHHQHQREEEEQPGNVLFIHNLPPDADEDLLSNMFSNYGTPADVRVIRDFRTNKCRGLAFVTMSNYEEASAAIDGLDRFVIGNNVLQVSREKVGGEPRERAGIFRPYDK